jgi:4-hydroxy-tetrahydrodipicolinate synthase
MKSHSGFSGVYPVVFALFDDAGALSREATRRQVAAMLKAGVHGITVLGLASEVNKLTTVERRTLLDWVAEDLAGKVPLAVTIAEPSVGGQIEFVKAAAAAGASWAILQPPPVRDVPEAELIRFFGSVADKSPIPLAIQNAPQYLGIGLGNAGLKRLNKTHPNIAIVKLEATAIAIRAMLDEVEGAFDVFNGHGGIEMTDCLRAGAVGVIPGAESCDVLARLFDEMASGSAEDEAAAERLYGEVLPLLEFLMPSIDNFLCYGKQVLGRRLGLSETSVRVPSTPPTAFGLAIAQRFADRLGPL